MNYEIKMFKKEPVSLHTVVASKDASGDGRWPRGFKDTPPPPQVDKASFLQKAGVSM